ncbi:MAG: hypothetical protein U0235_11385 [Polyangiaceae bacterium]
MSGAFTVATVVAAMAIPALGWLVGALSRRAEQARSRRVVR